MCVNAFVGSNQLQVGHKKRLHFLRGPSWISVVAAVFFSASLPLLKNDVLRKRRLIGSLKKKTPGWIFECPSFPSLRMCRCVFLISTFKRHHFGSSVLLHYIHYDSYFVFFPHFCSFCLRAENRLDYDSTGHTAADAELWQLTGTEHVTFSITVSLKWII